MYNTADFRSFFKQGSVSNYKTTYNQTWSWSYGSWIYNYLCNQCLSLLKLWVRTPFMPMCIRYNITW